MPEITRQGFWGRAAAGRILVVSLQVRVSYNIVKLDGSAVKRDRVERSASDAGFRKDLDLFSRQEKRSEAGD
jgi:hypothetical protein